MKLKKENYIHNLLKDQSGATSVLVILMLLVLVTFGSFAIISANSNIKLSKTAASWSKMYYALDAKGELYISEVDKRLYMAEIKALDYIEQKCYSELIYLDIPVELQTRIRNSVEENGVNSLTLYNAFNRVYYYYANLYLSEMAELYPENIVSALNDDVEITAVISDMLFVSSENPECHLNVSVEVRPMNYSFYIQDGEVSYEYESTKRYKILSWTQSQTKPVISDKSDEVWSGIIDGK